MNDRVVYQMIQTWAGGESYVVWLIQHVRTRILLLLYTADSINKVVLKKREKVEHERERLVGNDYFHS